MSEPTVKRCEAQSPDGDQCGNYAGHGGNHTKLIASEFLRSPSPAVRPGAEEPRTETMTREQIDELRELEAKATPGPWTTDDSHPRYRAKVYCDDALGSMVADCHGSHTVAISLKAEDANARLIAAMRTALPALLSEVSRLTAERDAEHTETTRLAFAVKKLEAELSALRGALTDEKEKRRILSDAMRTLIRKECDTKNLLDASDAMRQMVGVAYKALQDAAALGGGSPTGETTDA